jgi:hypothetical protein
MHFIVLMNIINELLNDCGSLYIVFYIIRFYFLAH